MAKSPRTFTSHSPPRARTLSGPATRRRSTREVLQTRNRAFGPNGVPTTSRQTSATRTDTTSRLPTSLGSTNKRYEPSTHLRPAAIIQDRRCAVGSWHHSPLDQRLHYFKCPQPRRDCDWTPEAYRPPEDTRRASQDPTTGCSHFRVTGCITSIEWDQRPLFRRLY